MRHKSILEKIYMKNKRIAIIPARSGSKRIPNKNIVDFYGKPMIYWTIQAAISSNLFDEILVSTDCEEIAKLSKSFGANVPFLRDQYYDDVSAVSEATIYALQQIEKYNNTKYDTIVQLMPNCPLRSRQTIIKLIKSFEKSNHNSMLSGFYYGMSNPWWAHKVNEDGSFEKVFNDDIYFNRSQDLPQLICPSGAIWISKRDALIKYNSFYSKDYKLFVLDKIEAVDIDDYEDLKFAQVAFQTIKKQ